MGSLLTAAQRNIEKIYERHHVKLDYYALESSSYDPATSVATPTQVPVVVRAQVEGAEALRSFANLAGTMIEDFTRLVSIPGADCVLDEVSFVPKTGEKIEWRSASVRAQGESYETFRVVQVFPRYIDGTPLTFLLSLQNA